MMIDACTFCGNSDWRKKPAAAVDPLELNMPRLSELIEERPELMSPLLQPNPGRASPDATPYSDSFAVNSELNGSMYERRLGSPRVTSNAGEDGAKSGSAPTPVFLHVPLLNVEAPTRMSSQASEVARVESMGVSRTPSMSGHNFDAAGSL